MVSSFDPYLFVLVHEHTEFRLPVSQRNSLSLFSLKFKTNSTLSFFLGTRQYLRDVVRRQRHHQKPRLFKYGNNLNSNNLKFNSNFAKFFFLFLLFVFTYFAVCGV